MCTNHILLSFLVFICHLNSGVLLLLGAFRKLATLLLTKEILRLVLWLNFFQIILITSVMFLLLIIVTPSCFCHLRKFLSCLVSLCPAYVEGCSSKLESFSLLIPCSLFQNSPPPHYSFCNWAAKKGLGSVQYTARSVGEGSIFLVAFHRISLIQARIPLSAHHGHIPSELFNLFFSIYSN